MEDLDRINEYNLPSLMNERFDELKQIENKVIKLQNSSLINKQKAEILREQGVGFFGKKRAIEELQEVSVLLANNQVDNSRITNEIIIYQQKTYETMKFLFALGVSNLANNRAVTSYLKEKLKSGEEFNGKFDEFQQKEILNVLKDLSAQQDILLKVERLNDKVRAQDSTIHELKISVSKYDSLLIEFEKMATAQREDIVEFKKFYGRPIDQNKKANKILILAIITLVAALIVLGISAYLFFKR